jgi:hypothetical protein
MNVLARSLAAPSGVACPVGKPSLETLSFGLASEPLTRAATNNRAKITFVCDGMPQVYRFHAAPIHVTSVLALSTIAVSIPIPLAISVLSGIGFAVESMGRPAARAHSKMVWAVMGASGLACVFLFGRALCG